MTTLAHSAAGRAILHALAFTLRPWRFALGISTRTVRPLAVLLNL